MFRYFGRQPYADENVRKDETRLASLNHPDRRKNYGDWAAIFSGNVIAWTYPARLLHHLISIYIKNEAAG